MIATRFPCAFACTRWTRPQLASMAERIKQESTDCHACKHVIHARRYAHARMHVTYAYHMNPCARPPAEAAAVAVYVPLRATEQRRVTADPVTVPIIGRALLPRALVIARSALTIPGWRLLARGQTRARRRPRRAGRQPGWRGANNRCGRARGRGGWLRRLRWRRGR